MNDKPVFNMLDLNVKTFMLSVSTKSCVFNLSNEETAYLRGCMLDCWLWEVLWHRYNVRQCQNYKWM